MNLNIKLYELQTSNKSNIQLMKAQIKQRPQSKRIRQTSSHASVRPTTRHVNTEQAKASFLQGKQLQGNDKFNNAIEQYIRATMYDPNYYQAYCNIGACYRSLRRFTDSRRFYRKAIAIKPDDAISRYNLGNAERLLGNNEESIIHYQYVISLKEEKGIDVGSLYMNSLINLGISYKNQDLFDKAAQCYEKVLKLNPNEQSALFNYGMCIVCSLNIIDHKVFHEVTKEQASKAMKLFKKVLEINKERQMAEFQLKRMSVLADGSAENIKKKVEELKRIQKKDNCSLRNQIQLEIGSCMKLLKDFEASDKHFRQSLTNNFRRRGSQKNVYDGTTYPNDAIKEGSPFSEEEGLKMIEDGFYKEVRAIINKMPDSDMTKHTLSLTLELSILKQNQGQLNLDTAKQIYENHFIKAGQKIPMDSISLAGHKAIGHLLSLQKKYNESIEHFEFVGSKIKTQQQKSAIHSSLGNDYEAIGDTNKAMSEYKMALESQPDSFELNYNIACCFYDQKNYAQAMKYFERFLELIDKDGNVKMETKQIYVADCLISMTGCISQIQTDKAKVYEMYMRAWNAVKLVRELGVDSFEFQDEKMETFYSSWAEILEERLDASPDKKSEAYLFDKQILLQIYQSLLSQLENSQSQDRDVILSNCATIYYEQKLYANALANYNQINNEDSLSYNNLALTYLHLHEHCMANKYITEAAQDELDVIETFNKGVIYWVYGFEDDHQENNILFQKLRNKSQDAILNRLEYGKMLIDVVTYKIAQISPGYEIPELKTTIYNTSKQQMLALLGESQQIKLTALLDILTKPKDKQVASADPKLIQLCLQVSKDPERDLEVLIKRCMELGQSMSQSIFQSLLNLFIFTHRPAVYVESMKKVLQKYKDNQTYTISIDFDRRVAIEDELKAKLFTEEDDIRNIGDLVAQMLNWQSQLEGKIFIVLKTIEKYYYKSAFKKPMEYQYHFPRHINCSQCPITFSKIAYFILTICPSLQIHLKGNNLRQMNISLYQQLQDGLAKKTKEGFKLQLGEKIVPITIYTFFHNKSDCWQFIKNIQKESSKKCELDVNETCKEVRIIISGLVRLVCIWEQVNPFLVVLKSFNQQLLPIEAQAVIGLPQDLQTLRQSSEKVAQIISEAKSLQS